MKAHHRLSVFLTAISFAMAPGANATTQYWDGSAITVNAGSDNSTTTTQTWLGGGNWDDGATSAPIASWTADDAAVFGGTAASQTITAGTLTASNLTFGQGLLGAGTSGTAYTISGGTITLSNSTITTNTAATISSTLTGSTGLTKAGASTLVLSTANNYTGGTTISAGTLQLTNVSGASASGAITLGDANTGVGTARLLASLGSNGILANPITVSASGTGTATLEQSVNFSSLSGLITLNRATTIHSSAADRTGITGKISGNVGTLTFTGIRTTLDNTVAHDFVGNIVVGSGALQTNSMSNALPLTASVTVNGSSIFQLNNGFSQSIDALNGGTAGTNGVQIIAGASATLTIGSNGGGGTFAGIIRNHPTNAVAFAIAKAGSGTQLFTGANTYTGGTTIKNGSLVLSGGNDRLATGGSVALGDIASSGKLVLGNTTAASNQTLAGLTSTGLAGSVVGAHASTDSVLTLNIASPNIFGGVLGGAGTNENRLALTKTGAGSLTLAAANTYTGATTISGGTLILGNATNTLASTGTVNFGGSGTLDVGSTTQSLANLNFNATATNAIIGSGTLNITGGTPAVGLAGFTTTLNLSGGATTTFTPTFYIGRSVVNSNTYQASGTVTVASGTTLNGSTINLAYSSYSGGNNAPASVGSLTVNGTVKATTLTLVDLTTANHSFSNSSATVTLNTGGTLTAATIAPGASQAGTITRTFNFNGGTLGNISTGNLAINAFGGTTPSFVLGASGTPTFDITTGRTGAVNQAMSGAGSLTKIGAGSLTLSAANTYTGGTNVNVGTLKAGVASVANTSGAFGKNSAVTLADAAGAILDITGFNTQIGSLAGGGASGGNVTLGGATLTTGANNSSTSYAGIISGSGALTKTGTGTQTLTGLNSYTGLTTVSDGTLAAGVANALNTGAVTVNGANAIYSLGTFNDSVGIVTLDGGGQISGSTGVLTSTAAFEMKSGSVSAILAGTGIALNKTTAGTTTLTGANLYTGATAINAGTLQLDFSAGSAPTDNIINSVSNSSSLSMSGGTLALKGKASTSNSQWFNGLNVTGGANTIQLTADATSNPMVLNLGTITHTGGSINFILPTGVQSASNGITTTTPNDANGVLGTWATVGDDLATNNGTNIVAFTGYTDVPFAGTIVDGAGTQVRLIGGISGDILLGSPVTTVNTILQNQLTTTMIDATSQTLRLGAAGGLVIPSDKAALNVGISPDSGFLTAGGTDNTSGVLTLANNSVANLLTVNSVIVDNGTGMISLGKQGAGTAILTAANTYSGATSIFEGKLEIGGAGQLNGGSHAGNITTNATFSYNSSANQTLSGVISGTGLLTKLNASTLTLSGTNTFTGITAVNAGVLSVATIGNGGVAGNLGQATNAAANLVLGGGTLKYTGANSSTDRSFTLTSSTNSSIDIDTGVNLTVSGASAATNGALTKAGLGTLTFTGTNAHTGGTTITGGTLQIGNGTTNGGFGPGAYSIGSNGTLKITMNSGGGTAPTWANISGTGTLHLKTAKSFDTGSFGTPTLPAGFTGTMVIESGRVAPAGASPYGMGGTSAIVVQPGGHLGLYSVTGTFAVPSLTIAGTGYGEAGYEAALRLVNTTVTGTVALAGNATIGAGAGNTGIFTNVVSGTGFNLTIGTSSMTGTIRLTGVNTYTGNTTIGSGATTLEIGGAGQLNSGNYAGNIASAGTFKYNSTASQTLSGVISSTGAVIKDNTGTLTLTNANNTYSGVTTVSGGTLLIDGTKNGTGAVNVASTATIGGTGTIAGTTTVNSGGFVAPGGDSAGTLSLATATLAGTYNCQLDVSAGDRVTVTGTLTINPTAAITISTIGTPAAASYTIASYTTLSGTLPTITGIPAGYSLDTSVAGQVKIVKSSYSAWVANFPGLSDTSVGGDPDKDGIKNLLEYVIGGNPGESSTSLLPTQSIVGTDLVLSYKRNDYSEADTTQVGQWSTDMLIWNDIPPVKVSENLAEPDDMTISIPLSNAGAEGKLFGRLHVTQP